MLPHLQSRRATRKRWPDGVAGPAFFAKDLKPGTPPWLTRVIRHTSGRTPARRAFPEDQHP
jgi:bifunctional non-homologous end joining protein LigD